MRKWGGGGGCVLCCSLSMQSDHCTGGAPRGRSELARTDNVGYPSLGVGFVLVSDCK
jgi:hypothetical protein